MYDDEVAVDRDVVLRVSPVDGHRTIGTGRGLEADSILELLVQEAVPHVHGVHDVTVESKTLNPLRIGTTPRWIPQPIVALAVPANCYGSVRPSLWRSASKVTVCGPKVIAVLGLIRTRACRGRR